MTTDKIRLSLNPNATISLIAEGTGEKTTFLREDPEWHVAAAFFLMLLNTGVEFLSSRVT